MRHRRLTLALLAFLALWLGAVVPAHPRGLIRLGGNSVPVSPPGSPDPGTHACCARRPTAGQAHESSRPGPARPPVSDCAICYYIATLDVPPPVTIDLAPSGVSLPVILPAPAPAPTIDRPLATTARGPPRA